MYTFIDFAKLFLYPSQKACFHWDTEEKKEFREKSKSSIKKIWIN